ncbi:MAG: FKBP-type peptidyl-prolyl cis-trans isomerase [Frankiales bacterium]|nr:FKBP-type peptidyl-prolyl cis-trans isomerase [Frankiales bacterium]
MTRRLLTLPATGLTLALTLAACGGSSNESVSAPAASPSSAAPSPSVSPPVCPITAKKVQPPVGSTTDLTTKPVVKGVKGPAPTDLTYADIVVGDGAEAVTGSQVTVKYVGAFYDTGKDFDSSWKTSPDQTLPFGICQQGVIPGFAVGPSGMKVGGRRLITIPGALAYGAAGQGDIPPNAALVFVVDLVKVG